MDEDLRKRIIDFVRNLVILYIILGILDLITTLVCIYYIDHFESVIALIGFNLFFLFFVPLLYVPVQVSYFASEFGLNPFDCVMVSILLPFFGTWLIIGDEYKTAVEEEGRYNQDLNLFKVRSKAEGPEEEYVIDALRPMADKIDDGVSSALVRVMDDNVAPRVTQQPPDDEEMIKSRFRKSIIDFRDNLILMFLGLLVADIVAVVSILGNGLTIDRLYYAMGATAGLFYIMPLFYVPVTVYKISKGLGFPAWGWLIFSVLVPFFGAMAFIDGPYAIAKEDENRYQEKLKAKEPTKPAAAPESVVQPKRLPVKKPKKLFDEYGQIRE